MNQAFELFEQFKRQDRQYSSKTKIQNIYFKIDFDQKGAFLSIVNNKYKDVQVDYLQYNGEEFSLLRSIDAIRKKNSFVIDWEGDSDKVYFADNEYLMYQLLRCDNIIGPHNYPLTFEKKAGQLELIVEPENEQFKAEISLQHKDFKGAEFKIITDNFLLSGSTLYEFSPIGMNFRLIEFFNTEISKDQLELFFSIFFSHLFNIDVSFLDYSVFEDESNVSTKPIIIFEKIDEDGALIMKVSQTVSNFDYENYEQFELVKFAEINELDKKIRVRNIDHQSIDFYVAHVAKLIKKHVTKNALKNDIAIEDNLVILQKELAGNFIMKDLPDLLKDFVIIGAEKLKSYKIKTVKPKLNIKLDHGIDFLEGEATLEFDNEKVNLFEAINQFSKNKYILLSDGSKAIVNNDYISKLQRIFKKQKDGKVNVSFFDLPLVEELIEGKINDSVFKRHRKIFEGFNTIKSSRVKLPDINATLRDYQKKGFKWMNYLHENKLGGCLADDMGLGKTIQTIAMLLKIYPEQKQPSLIVMPRSLLFNWHNEIEKFNPPQNGLTSYLYHGTDRNFEEAKNNDVILTTYAIVRNDIELLQETDFYYVILDESQNIKNLNSQITKAVMLLNSSHKLSLSGTPIENNLGELYSLFRFLNPAMFGSLNDFNKNYGIPVQKNNDKEAIQALRTKIYPFILRRLKKEVLKELPDSVEQHLFVEMPEKQMKYYEMRRMYYKDMIKSQIAQNGLQKSQIFVFQALSELRQIASIPETRTDGKIESAKKELLFEYLLEAIANNHKIIVFSNFIGGIDIVSEMLNSENIEFETMTGSTRDREQRVERFQNDKNCKVFVMTLKTGGVGLNLTAADTVFIFDPWWNRAAELQAINRTHRIGQKNKVHSYRLITKGTIEEKIMLLQQKKADLFENLIGSDSASVKSLTEEDIDFILN